MSANRQWLSANQECLIVTRRWPSKLKLLLLYFSFFFFQISNAQKISASLDRDKIVLGEQVSLQLKVEDIDKKKSFISAWFVVPDTANQIQVVRREPIDTVDVNGLTTYLQKIIITAFDSGKWQLPLLKIVVQEISSGKHLELKAANITLDVLPVDVSGLKDYHDVKEILEVDPYKNYWWIIVASASALLFILLFFFILKRKKKPVLKKSILKGTAYERAMQKMETLKNKSLDAKLFYETLDEICRNYFDEQLQINTMKSTGDEIVISLNKYLIEEPIRTEFIQLVRLIDVVKFAKYIPSDKQNIEILANAKKTIQYINQLYTT